jgi:hypothetical protein
VGLQLSLQALIHHFGRSALAPEHHKGDTGSGITFVTIRRFAFLTQP